VAHDSFPLQLDLTQARELFSLSTKTLAMSILAGTGAGLAGIILSFPAARNMSLPGGILNLGSGGWISRWWGRVVYGFSRALLLFSRAIPAPIWALILLFVLFPGILPGAIALGLYNFGILGRLKAEVVENLDDRPLRALKAQGAPESGVFLYGVIPATFPRFVAYSLYRWEVCIRATVIVGLVGAGGLGRLLTEQLSSFDYPGVAATLIVFVLLTFLVDLVSASVRRTLR
jgi:phosphonate transport system permease protein